MTRKPLDYEVVTVAVINRKQELKRKYDEVFEAARIAKGTPRHSRLIKIMTKIEKQSKKLIRSNVKIFRKIKSKFWSHIEEVALDGDTVKN